MLQINDKFVQKKAIGEFNYIGKMEFIVESIDGNMISFNSNGAGFGKGVVTLTEFDEHFEKVEYVKVRTGNSKKYIKNHSFDIDGVYVNMPLFKHGTMLWLDSGKKFHSSLCHEEDIFDLEKGIKVCEDRARASYYQEKIKTLTNELRLDPKFQERMRAKQKLNKVKNRLKKY